MDLLFIDPGLHRVCNQKHLMIRRLGQQAEALAQLLIELAGAEDLELVAQLPHVTLTAAAKRRVAVSGAREARVLLTPSSTAQAVRRDPLCLIATRATVLAVCVGEHDINPKGANWS